MIRAGTSAYLPRDAGTGTFLRAIRDAGTGQVAIPSQAATPFARTVGRHDAISERESEVMRRVARGKANKQIARGLNIAQSTVKTHVGSLLSELSLVSRTEMDLLCSQDRARQPRAS
jgi:DNA-binding NarL/FixJ family response regulator